MSRPISASASVTSPRQSPAITQNGGWGYEPLPESLRIRLLPIGEPDGSERLYPATPGPMFGWLKIPLAAVALLFAVCGTMIALSWNTFNVTPPTAADKPARSSSATPTPSTDKTRDPRPVSTPTPVRSTAQPSAVIVPANTEPSAVAESTGEPTPSQMPVSPEPPVLSPTTPTSSASEQTSEQPPASPEQAETTSASTAPANPETSTQPSEATTP